MSRVLGSKLIGAVLLGLLICSSWTSMAQAVELPPLRLEMDKRDADVLFKKDPNDQSSFPVTVVDGERRLKGMIKIKGSFTRHLPKRSFDIKLENGEKWRNLSRISVNAMGTDPSLMRERLAWQLMDDLGMVIPDVRYIQVYINGTYRGLFLFIEWVDAKMLARKGLGPNGEFYLPQDKSFCGDLSPTSVKDQGACFTKLNPRDDDYTSLKKLVQEIAQTPADRFHEFLDRRFDADSVVNWFVTNTIVSDGDTYNKNYFLYLSPEKKKWVVIPFDYDLTFGRNWDPYLPYPKSVLNGNFQYYYPSDLGAPSPFKDKILANPVLMKRIKDRLALLLGPAAAGDPVRGWAAPQRFVERIDAYETQIGEAVRTDPYMSTQTTDHDEQVDALRYYALARTAYLNKVILQTTDWQRDRAVAEAGGTAGRAQLVDGWGYTLAMVAPRELKQPVSVHVEVERAKPPALVPPGHTPAQCVQRTWYLTVRTPGEPLQSDVTFEYIEENSKNREVGARVADERKLVLWMHDGNTWRNLPTRANGYANTVTSQNIVMPRSRLLSFVACQPPVKALEQRR